MFYFLCAGNPICCNRYIRLYLVVIVTKEVGLVTATVIIVIITMIQKEEVPETVIVDIESRPVRKINMLEVFRKE